MREIKFRFFDGGKMCEVGDLTFFADNAGYHINGEFPSTGKDLYPLMQFTGLLDKNGKEIYEGDVIHCTAGMHTVDKSFQTDEKKIVTFEDGAFRYDGITLGDMVHASMSEYSFEVIGNIYENPELLK